MMTKTVDGVLSALNKAVNELGTVAAQQERAMEVAQSKIARALDAKETARTEAERAKRIKGKLEELLT